MWSENCYKWRQRGRERAEEEEKVKEKGRGLKCVKYPLVFSFSNISLEKTLESPLDCKEIQPVHPKGVQSWVFIGRTDVEAETPILWPPDAKS